MTIAIGVSSFSDPISSTGQLRYDTVAIARAESQRRNLSSYTLRCGEIV